MALLLARCGQRMLGGGGAGATAMQAAWLRDQQACSTSGSTSADSAQSEPAQPAGGNAGFDAGLLPFLVCPVSKQPLRYDAKSNELVSEALGVAFPIRDGVPVLIPLEGRLLLEPDED